MIRKALLLAAAAGVAFAGAAEAKPRRASTSKPVPAATLPAPAVVAAQLRDTALQGTIAYSIVEGLTTRGPRLAGSDAEKRAAAWGEGELKRLGFDKVAIETFPLHVWERGEERVEVVGAAPQRLSVTALGGSVPTPAEGVEGDVALFETWQDFLDAAPGSLTGKIAVVLQETPRTQNGSGYGSTGVIRRLGPSEAGKRGAVGFLLRSLATGTHRFPHTGTTAYADGSVPSFALAAPDADQLRRLSTLGQPVRLRLFSSARSKGMGTSQNVVAEVTGREKPEEVILIGGHLDSWDLGTGAIDDASGVAITTAALKLIGDLPRPPRRTIRVVWFGSEEVAQPAPLPGAAGGTHYAESRKAELATHVAAAESDFGAERVYSLGLPAGASDAFRREASRVLAPLGVFVERAPVEDAGVDVGPSVRAGVPPFRLNQDGTDYFDVHHTADDVIDRVDAKALDQNVAAWAALLWLIADSDVDFRSNPAAAAAR